MTAAESVARFVDALNENHVEYMIVGSFSSNVYGNPRSTKDADFVVEMGSTSIGQLSQSLGTDFILEAQMSFETITATSRYKFRVRDSIFLIEVFLLSDDPHDRMRFQRKVDARVGQRTVYAPTAEDVIITKLRWSKQGNRQKDTDDVRDVLAVQHGKLDLTYIRGWCDQHGTRELLEELLAEAEAFDREQPR